MKHTLVCLVENKAGVLNRVVTLFRRRNFNMDSLTVGRTHNPETSRITIVMEGEPGDSKKVMMNLYKLVDVIEVQDLTNLPAVNRDLVLAKVSTPDAFTRNELSDVCYKRGARLVDIGPEVTIVELAGAEELIESFVDELRPFGIVELVRSGLVSMGRGIRIMEGANHTSKRFPQKINGNGKHDSA